MSRHELTDAAWQRLAPLLPPQRPRDRAARPRPPDHHQRHAVADQDGEPWRELPERYGPWRTVATRFYRWTKSGLWQRILAELQRMGDAAAGSTGASI